MRELIILPGNSESNRTWGGVMQDEYGPRFEACHLQSYEHWETNDPVIDFDVELVKLRERTKPLFAPEETVVLAKSAGSLLALVAVSLGIITPTKCVFFGIPFDLAAAGIFKDDWSAVDNFKVPTIAFHNEKDPTADYRYTLATIAERLPTVKFVTTYEEDHWYGDTGTYNKELTSFIG